MIQATTLKFKTLPPKLAYNFETRVFKISDKKGSRKRNKSIRYRNREMDSSKNAGSSLDSLMSSFNARVLQLQELVIARNSEFFNLNFFYIYIIVHIDEFVPVLCCAVYPASSIADLSAIDAAVTAMELQVQAIKDRFREETEAIPKTKALSLFLLQKML